MSIKNLRPVFGGKFKQGYFKVSNVSKYIGDPNKIIARSSWEAKFMSWCDQHPSVIRWSSEPVAIPYISPLDKKAHKYYVDFYVVTMKEDKELQWLIEIKPAAQFKPPDPMMLEGRRTLKKIQSYNWQLRTFIINSAKFESAVRFAQDRNMRFAIADENFLF